MVDIIINCRRDVSMERISILMNSVPDELKDKITEILRREAEEIRDEARAEAPVKTGVLRDLIISRDTPSGAEVIGGAYYTGFQEWGTIHINPLFFMTKAFRRYQPILTRKIQQKIIDHFRSVT